MTISRIGVAVLGCGRIARLAHLRVLAGLPGVAVTAIADADEGRLEQAADVVPQAARCRDYREALAREDVAAVVICLPPALHAAAAIDAFTTGRHAYVEKPLALSLADGLAVCDAWRRSGRLGMIGFNFRFGAQFLEARTLLRAGALGELVGARSVFSSAPRPLPPWKRSPAGGGGALFDLASHHADMARFLFGEEITAVWANVRATRFEGDTAFVEMRTGQGLTLQSMFALGSVEEHTFTIYGTKGRLVVDRLERRVQVTRPLMPYDRLHRIWNAGAALRPGRLLRGPSEPSFAASLRAFVEAVRDGTPHAPDLDDGLRSLAVIVAAGAAAHTGQVEAIPPVAAPAAGPS